MDDAGVKTIGVEHVNMPVGLLDSAENVSKIGAEEVDGRPRHKVAKSYRKDWHQDGVVAAMRGCTLVGGVAVTGKDVVVVVSDEGTRTPLDMSVIEADVLPFAFVVLAVHQFHVCAWGVPIEVLETFDAIIAVGPQRIFGVALGEYLYSRSVKSKVPSG